ncbi:carboxylate-amine ligase [Candidatus Laterigemmans baculatus]|uniref:carboxylate-amine ligase n=1 Tax=Candidatus Laterigemmans baculatus TaxID=2770505 RepID=UPI0013D9BF98|nr:glutamate-cysteine ligase family protein [Candidatus Laterigemmans baculatus]
MNTTLGLFSALGIEIEYGIIDAKRMNVRPVADRILVDRDGDPVSDLRRGAIVWSNELVNHVIELKTSEPAPSLAGLSEHFHQNVKAANKRLAAFGARLMPTAMHPWMQPARETQLWLGDSSEIYETFNRIFDCTGHGWSNVQSMHLNLPFDGDEEFGRLHAAVRLVLPILPALAASSPIVDGRRSEYLDTRLNVYEHNCDRIPSVCGGVIPEPVYSEAEYRRAIFEPMYRDLAPHDPDGVLQDEFLNSRGAIARFQRGSLEIRVIDVQECPAADLAIAGLTTSVVRRLVEQIHTSTAEQQAVDSGSLRQLFRQTVREGEAAEITDAAYLAHFGITLSPAQPSVSAGELWKHLLSWSDQSGAEALPAELKPVAEKLVHSGTLASRILQAVGDDFSPNHLRTVYAHLCDRLAENQLFIP